MQGVQLHRIVPLALCLAACQTAAGTGPIEIGLGSDPAAQALRTGSHGGHDIVSAVVTLTEVDFEIEGLGWVPVVVQPRTIDLLALDGKDFTSLGVVTLPAGKVKALRFFFDASSAMVILKNGQTARLELPDQGVLKVKGSFHLAPCAKGSVIIDFDPKVEVSDKHGQKKYELRCKARIKVRTSDACGGDDAGSGGSDGGDPCAGVVCAPNEMCENGLCVPDPCFGVVCAPGETCRNGACTGGMPDMSAPPDMTPPRDMTPPPDMSRPKDPCEKPHKKKP
jgi:hypothetical protein